MSASSVLCRFLQRRAAIRGDLSFKAAKPSPDRSPGIHSTHARRFTPTYCGMAIRSRFSPVSSFAAVHDSSVAVLSRVGQALEETGRAKNNRQPQRSAAIASGEKVKGKLGEGDGAGYAPLPIGLDDTRHLGVLVKWGGKIREQGHSTLFNRIDTQPQADPGHRSSSQWRKRCGCCQESRGRP
jgi:hypothetical protein